MGRDFVPLIKFTSISTEAIWPRCSNYKALFYVLMCLRSSLPSAEITFDSLCFLVPPVPQNKCAWLVSPDHDEEELLQPTSRRLPLYVQSMRWRMLSGDLAVSVWCVCVRVCVCVCVCV